MAEDTVNRKTIANALDGDLPMHLFKKDGISENRIYVGLWGIWWPDDEVVRAKVILATIRKPTDEHTNLSKLPWLILQFQVIDSNHRLWNDKSLVLKTEITEQTILRAARCENERNHVGFYDSTSSAHNQDHIQTTTVVWFCCQGPINETTGHSGVHPHRKR